MINNDELEAILLKDDTIELATVEGDGYHYHLNIVSDSFAGKRPVARQQWVYTILKPYITSGQLHAVTMKTWTKTEWENRGA